MVCHVFVCIMQSADTNQSLDEEGVVVREARHVRGLPAEGAEQLAVAVQLRSHELQRFTRRLRELSVHNGHQRDGCRCTN